MTEEVMSSFDEDEDEALSESEFSSFVSNLSEKIGQDIDAQELFAQMDEDEDGSVTEAEIEEYNQEKRPPISAYQTSFSTEETDSLLNIVG
ncbi:hypothetical protein BX659_102212 [Orenia metallireducens]|uniref:EF-hand domain-containing protein n=1 Tax=Orenia metallireducens TaxID=1413210 RepID=A0A285F4U8_9FIRM|nr:hypothetical protein [Orenia metallireducens]PRX34894.1 hypothetical protein BX659_102212 [Orenia metallireducens]SNY06083.1 hypothetical protein SAMN06265827_101212 [Orenia metallireducens]